MRRFNDYYIRRDSVSTLNGTPLQDWVIEFGTICEGQDEYIILEMEPEKIYSLECFCAPELIEWFTVTKPYTLANDESWSETFKPIMIRRWNVSDMNPDVYCHVQTTQGEIDRLQKLNSNLLVSR